MIYKTGKYTKEEIPLETYHNVVEAISKTNLDYIHQSYLHYLTSKLPLTLTEPVPKCLTEGAALHSLVLTPDQFATEFKVLPELDRRTKAGKAYYNHELAEGKPLISSEEFSNFEEMAKAIANHPSASLLLKDGTPETSYIWTDSDTGVTCKCRPDYLQRLVIVDIKTCQDASYDAFQRAIIDHRYHVQGAYFLDGVHAVDGGIRDFILIAVEKDPPYAVAVYKLDEVFIDAGRAAYKEDLKRYATHIQNPTMWQGYDPMVVEMGAPAWIKKSRIEPKTTTASVLL